MFANPKSRLAGTAVASVALFLGTMMLAVIPPAGAAAGIALNLPVAAGLTIRAGGPHGGGVGNSVDIGGRYPGDSLAVYAAAGGTVEGIYSQGGFSRCRVRIGHADGWSTEYQHLINVPGALAVGQSVGAGQLIGYAGDPSSSGGDTCGSGYGRHVHFSIYRYGSPVSIDGTSIGGYTVHAGASAYEGTWTDDDTGATVVNSNGPMACCLVNDKQTSVSGSIRESGHSVVSDQSGRVWSFAVTQAGTLKYRYTGPSGWQAWKTVGSGYRSVAATVDESGRVVMAYVTEDGVMKVRRTYAAPTSSDDGGGFGSSSPAFGAGNWANVSITTDRVGRAWLAATKTYGRAYFTRQNANGEWTGSFTEFGNDDWQSITIASESDSDGRVWIFATKTDGDLWYQHTDSTLANWDNKTAAGSGWAGDVSASGDNRGRMWMFGVKANGTLMYRHTDSTGWGNYVTMPGSSWASVSSGVKTNNGVMWMFATKTDGDLSYRYTDNSSDYWTDPAAVAGGPWK